MSGTDALMACILAAAVLMIAWPFVRLWLNQHTPCAGCGHPIAQHIASEASCLADPPDGSSDLLWCDCRSVVRRGWLR